MCWSILEKLELIFKKIPTTTSKKITLGRAKGKGLGEGILPALAFRRRRISCQQSWRAA